jgi:hypothetical protein
VVNALLACGVGYGLLFVIANDLIAAGMYDGYSRIDQAVSELSATDAPSRAFLTALTPVFTLLMLGFGIGVWKSAHGNRGLRITAGILIAQAAMLPLWAFAPMTARDELVEGALTANDTGHIILSAVSVVLIVAEMCVAAAALGRRFRIFSIATLASVLFFGALFSMKTPNLESGDLTPWMGFLERAMLGGWLVWMSGLAVTLWLRNRAALRERDLDA